ncbi:MAG: ATP-grasp domain-containing protein [Patescibacteria group bacterium]|nr:ATP-grasp domain-containing protein [Patescibacteria group bacterium]
MNKNNNKICLILYNVLLDDVEPDDSDSVAMERTEIGAVRKSLKELGYEVRTLGLRRITAKVISQIEEIDPDFIFNLCESLYKRSKAEMYIAGLFELLRIPYTGSPPLALGLALNKKKANQILKSIGIPVPPSVVALPGEDLNFGDLTPPFIVKPLCEDGSAGITSKSVVESYEAVKRLIRDIHENYCQPAIIEEFIDGRELIISLLEEEGVSRVLAVSEIDFSDLPKNEPKIVSYDAKWNKKSPLYHGTKLICPAEIDNVLKNRIEKIAIKVFKEIGCRDYARVDMRISENRRPYVVEVNTNPDIAPESGFENAAIAAGMTYIDFISAIVKNTLKRNSRKEVVEKD